MERHMSTETLAIIFAVLTALAFAAIGILYIRGRRLSVEEFIVNRNTAGAGSCRCHRCCFHSRSMDTLQPR